MLSLYSGIDVEFQEMHKISRILVLASFHYSDNIDVNIINFDVFMTSCLDCNNYTSCITLLFFKISSSNFQEINIDTWFFMNVINILILNFVP